MQSCSSDSSSVVLEATSHTFSKQSKRSKKLKWRANSSTSFVWTRARLAETSATCSLILSAKVMTRVSSSTPKSRPRSSQLKTQSNWKTSSAPSEKWSKCTTWNDIKHATTTSNHWSTHFECGHGGTGYVNLMWWILFKYLKRVSWYLQHTDRSTPGTISNLLDSLKKFKRLNLRD